MISQETAIAAITGLAGTAIAYFSLKREAMMTAIEQARSAERRFTVLEAEIKVFKDDLLELKDLVTETQQTTDEIFNLLMIQDNSRSR